MVVLLAPGPREKASIYSGACEHLVRVAELVIRIEPFRTGATQLAVGKIEIHRGGMRIRGDPGAKNIDKVTKTIQLSVEPGSGGMRVSRKGYAAGTL